MKSLLIILSLLAMISSGAFAQTLKKKTYIEISIAGVHDSEISRISKRYRIDDKGNLRLPLLAKDVKAAGLSISKVQRAIENAYKAEGIYTGPIITISTSTSKDVEQAKIEERQDKTRREIEEREAKKVVFIGGKISKPAKYKYIPGMTVADLIAEAGGPNSFGTKRRFALTRNNKTTYYNYHKNKALKFTRLRVGDHVSIPASTLRNP